MVITTNTILGWCGITTNVKKKQNRRWSLQLSRGTWTCQRWDQRRHDSHIPWFQASRCQRWKNYIQPSPTEAHHLPHGLGKGQNEALWTNWLRSWNRQSQIHHTTLGSIGKKEVSHQPKENWRFIDYVELPSTTGNSNPMGSLDSRTREQPENYYWIKRNCALIHHSRKWWSGSWIKGEMGPEGYAWSPTWRAQLCTRQPHGPQHHPKKYCRRFRRFYICKSSH